VHRCQRDDNIRQDRGVATGIMCLRTGLFVNIPSGSVKIKMSWLAERLSAPQRSLHLV